MRFNMLRYFAVNDYGHERKIGNFVHRVLEFVRTKFDGKIPPSRKEDIATFDPFIQKVNVQLVKYKEHMKECKIKQAIDTMFKIIKLGNEAIQGESKERLINGIEGKPWLFTPSSKNQYKSLFYVMVNLVDLLAILLTPFLPTLVPNIYSQLNITPPKFMPFKFKLTLPSQTPLGKQIILVPPKQQSLMSKIASIKSPKMD